jgi:hypothetical protein
MSNFDLNLTGAQINAALNKVHNPDATPTNGSANVVTSNGVHDAVNDIQFANLNNNLVKTDISSGTNNSTLASSAAIKSYVDNSVAPAQNPNVAYFTATSSNRNSDGNVNNFVETSDPGGFCSTDGTTIAINQNTICTVIFSGRFIRSYGNSNTWFVDYRLYDNGFYTNNGQFNLPALAGGQQAINNDSEYKRFTKVMGFNSIGLDRTMYASMYLNESYTGTAYWKECTITVIRHLQA